MLKLIADRPAFKVCFADPVLHVRVHRGMLQEDLEALEQDLNTVVQGRAQPIVSFTTMHEVNFSPSPGVRQAASAMASRVAKRFAATAIVLDAEGIKATILRTVINTITLASRMHDCKVFTDHQSASVWLKERARSAGLAVDEAALISDAKATAKSATPA